MNRAQEVLIYITAYHQEQNAEGREGGFNYWSDLDDIGVLKNHVEHPPICVSQKEKDMFLGFYIIIDVCLANPLLTTWVWAGLR